MFDAEAARKAGYTDAEIADFLAKSQRLDLAAAKRAGYSDGEIIAQLSAKMAASPPIPGQEGEAARVAAARSQPRPTLGERVIGTGEAALTAVTGATGGTLGMIGGTLKGLAEQILSGNFGTPEAARLVEQSAAEGAQALTFAPRTESGQVQAQALGELAQNLIPLAGLTPAAGAAGAVRPNAPAGVVARAGAIETARSVAGAQGAAAATGAIRVADRVAEATKKGATTLPRRAVEALRRQEQAPTPGTKGSVGAAATDMANQRIATAQSLPVPVQLTRGQATRDPAQLKFEVETAKMPEEGIPLRQRAMEQNEAVLQNFDVMLDMTGAQAPTLRAVGAAVDKALVQQAARDKAQVRAAYKAAETAGEMEAPVNLSALVQHLNEAAPEAATAPLLTTARAKALQLGVAVEQNGQLVPAPVPLKTAELFRQSINRATDFEPTNVRQSTIMRGLVDEATNGLGGDLYREARKLRQRFAQNYEDRAAISKLLRTKRGTTDRNVALEDVFGSSILQASLDDVRNVRRVLQRSGADGAQAWKELQGATLNWVRDQATKNVATDASGNRVISAAGLDKAVRELDVDGRLDFIFGKQGAQQLRDLNDLAKYVKTVPPEAGINTSNTAATLLAAFGDVVLSTSMGIPAPLATSSKLALSRIKDVKLRKRIAEALNNAEKNAQKKRF